MSWAAVIEASTEGDRRALAQALEKAGAQGAAVANASDGLQRTALSWACANGHAGCVKLLLSSRAEPSRADNYGYTALHEACSFGHEACSQLLLERRPANRLERPTDPNLANAVGEAAVQ